MTHHGTSTARDGDVSRLISPERRVIYQNPTYAWLFYGPGFVKVRFGGAAVTNVWSEETQDSIVPISRSQAGPSSLLQQSTGARLRAMLLSARVRKMRREQAAAEPIRIPSLLSDASDSDSESDYASDSDSVSSASSKFTSYSLDSLTSAGSPPATPAKAAPIALPAVVAYRPPFRRVKTVTKPVAARTTVPAPGDRSKKDTTAYLYQGGVTRVMTGGVMLGPRHVVRATRS
ncbi:hypothetical protein C8R47DRAFT_596407 [Mycena vitilis]|nr:hypothetical protein C8R47DRAFT_596407 [Mycena vitilis]